MPYTGSDGNKVTANVTPYGAIHDLVAQERSDDNVTLDTKPP